MLRAAVCLLAAGLAVPALAEVVTDGTVGPRVHLSGDFEVGADLGTQAGHNLFHSFDRFSLSKGERATFSGPGDVRNIISRVTGHEPSNIDGTIRSTIAGADFYFINPAGVMFGPNASLDLQGSFHVSTADELRFADGSAFSATNATPSSFSVAAPEAFGFLGARPAAITVAGSHLSLPGQGRTLSLTGGGLVVANGSELTANNVALAAQASAGSVRLALDRPAEARDGVVRLGLPAAGAAAGVASGGLVGGRLRIEAGELLISNAVVGDLHVAPTDSTGGVDIAARRVVIRSDNLPVGATIGILTSSLGTGRAGNVHIAASEVTLLGGLIASAPTGADGGRVEIEADRILIAAGTNTTAGIGVPTGAFGSGSGASGGATITARQSLTLGAGGQINSASLGERPAGSIVINLGAHAAMVMQPGSGIEATARGTGDGGDITITGGDLLMTGAVISGETFTAGHGGTTDIETGRLTLNDSFVGANAREDATGHAGLVTVDADRIELTHHGRIFNGTDGAGDGGDVRVRANSIVADAGHDPTGFQTGISAGASAESRGAGGNLTVTADQIELINGAQISSDTKSTGSAGTVTVTAGQIELRDGGQIFATSSSSGAAGNIIIRAGRIDLNNGRITAETASTGGGKIRLSVDDVVALQDSGIATSVAGGQDPTAGNIVIDPKVLVIDGSQIQANAPVGFGGNVTIEADNILVPGGDFQAVLDRGDISASGGDPTRNGTVAVNAPEVDLSGGLLVLQSGFVDTAPLRARCGARHDLGTSSFTGVGRAGLPATPDAPLASAYSGAVAAAATLRAGFEPTGGTTPATDSAGSVPPCAPWD
jgi:filamentous hemagglutinin family protein